MYAVISLLISATNKDDAMTLSLEVELVMVFIFSPWGIPNKMRGSTF
jgi:hypothetical protein